MPAAYTAPLDEMRFVLYHVLDAERLFQRLGHADATRELIDAVLEEGARFSQSVLAPLNAIGDEVGCTLDRETGRVATPPGFREAYRQYVEGGWPGLVAPQAYGGQGLPHTLGDPLKEMIDAACLAWGNFPLLSHGATEALLHHGSDWQREVFLKPMIEGRWTGTMCLTEPHCGSDLGLLKTRAEPLGEGRHAITGTKIFITAGEHDLTDNIVHLVLARLPDAPPGSRGISMFIVPKRKVAQDGTQGPANAVRCGALEHKMGIHASATCVMNFDGAEGWLIGEPNKGLAAMFTMMNTARLAVGLQGLSLAERAWQNALHYARERLQMRALSGPKFPDKPADPIIVHPDVRRMLLTQKALIEGGRVLAYDAATRVDVLARSDDPAERERAEAAVGFLTPIVKACLTEWGVECTYLAMQCYGGHGYIREHGLEQLARDARITTLYEGTTGIQALDLAGRKLVQLKGAGLKVLLGELAAFLDAHGRDADIAEFAPQMGALATQWQTLSVAIAHAASGNAEEIGAAAYDYLFFSGYVLLAHAWLRQVVASRAHPPSFHEAKRETTRFVFTRMLPRAQAHAAAIGSGAATLMALDAEQFDA